MNSIDNKAAYTHANQLCMPRNGSFLSQTSNYKQSNRSATWNPEAEAAALLYCALSIKFSNSAFYLHITIVKTHAPKSVRFKSWYVLLYQQETRYFSSNRRYPDHSSGAWHPFARMYSRSVRAGPSVGHRLRHVVRPSVAKTQSKHKTVDEKQRHSFWLLRLHCFKNMDRIQQTSPQPTSMLDRK